MDINSITAIQNGFVRRYGEVCRLKWNGRFLFAFHIFVPCNAYFCKNYLQLFDIFFTLDQKCDLDNIHVTVSHKRALHQLSEATYAIGLDPKVIWSSEALCLTDLKTMIGNKIRMPPYIFFCEFDPTRLTILAFDPGMDLKIGTGFKFEPSRGSFGSNQIARER